MSYNDDDFKVSGDISEEDEFEPNHDIDDPLLDDDLLLGDEEGEHSEDMADLDGSSY